MCPVPIGSGIARTRIYAVEDNFGAEHLAIELQAGFDIRGEQMHVMRLQSTAVHFIFDAGRRFSRYRGIQYSSP